MHYLYHRVPKNLTGDTLYPLNVLRTKLPAIYEGQVSKYIGREEVTQQRIPLLDNCLWNDVIFMTSVNPADLFKARREAGWGDTEPQQYFKIDPATLDPSKLAVFLFSAVGPDTRTVIKPSEFTEYRYDDLPKYAVVPEVTKEYFSQQYCAGEPRIKLFFRFIPHILYKGEIDISSAEVITVS